MPHGDEHKNSGSVSGRRGAPRQRGTRDAKGRQRSDSRGARSTEQPRGGPSRPTRARDDRSSNEATPVGPEIADDVDPLELDKDVRVELASLSSSSRSAIIGHLVMASRLIDDDPEGALEHANAARRLAGRIGVVREAAGLAAYRAGDYAAALRELRAARRLTGSDEHLPIMADCERGLGRPRRALELVEDSAASGLDTAGKVEALMVAAGARRDLGDQATAVVMLQVPELQSETDEMWVPRLRYAYADALLDAGRADDARQWFERAAAADPDGLTDAAVRVDELSQGN